MKIWTIPHTLFAAKHLAEQINKLGYHCELVSKIDLYDEDLYIIYGAKNCESFPKNYIVYQTEIAGTHFFDAKYLNIIKNAVAVWEYSKENKKAYSHKFTSVVSPGISIQEQQVAKDIPFLFYGWIEGSARRKKIIDEIQMSLRYPYHPAVKVVTNTTGEEMWSLLSRSIVVLNLHYHDNSPLEVFRINEALSHQCQVVSEGPQGIYYDLIHCGSTSSELLLQLLKCRLRFTDLTKAQDRLNNFYEVREALRIVRRIKPESFRI